MYKRENKKLFIIIGLSLAIIGLGIGFAAFSSSLKISSNLTVNPNPDDFKLVFVPADKDGNAVNTLIPDAYGNPQLNKNENGEYIEAQLNGTTLENIDLVFTEPGQGMSYYVRVENTGKYRAYLHNIFYKDPKEPTTNSSEYSISISDSNGNFIKRCTGIQNEKGEYPDQNMLNAACQSLELSLMYDIKDDLGAKYSISNQSMLNIKNTYIEPGEAAFVQFWVGYPETGTRVDGDFKVEFADIELEYKTTSNIE